MKIKEIRGKSDQELLAEIKNLKEELFRLRFRKVTDVVENPSLVRGLRKDIARMKTILQEKQITQLPNQLRPAASEQKSTTDGDKTDEKIQEKNQTQAKENQPKETRSS